MTLTIDLTPSEEARLVGVAQQEGLGLPALAHKIVTAYPAPPALEEDLNAESHDLVDLDLGGQLTETQAARLRWVEQKLDEADAQDPLEQEMDRRVRETGSQLDAILALLKKLPQTQAPQ